MNERFDTILALVINLCASFAFTVLLGYIVIPYLHKLKFGQTILDIGPNWHKNKQGTPTMGGMMFIVGMGIPTALIFVANHFMGDSIFTDWGGDAQKSSLFSGLLMALAFGMVGFADDYIKVVKKRNKGLSILQKTGLQLVICVVYLYSLYMSMNKEPYMFIPFVGNVQLGWFFWPFGICVIYGAINAVNFTDGIDGLCSGVTVTAAAAFTAIGLILGFDGTSIAAASLAGGCLGFYKWNRNPAKVFMGDTGSMFLGGMVVALAFSVNCPLILLLVGIIYVVEAMSDVIQIGYFKMTHGKRIFKMAPIHHHYEMKGWKEKKIVRVFTAVNTLGCLIGTALMFFGKN